MTGMHHPTIKLYRTIIGKSPWNVKEKAAFSQGLKREKAQGIEPVGKQGQCQQNQRQLKEFTDNFDG